MSQHTGRANGRADVVIVGGGMAGLAAGMADNASRSIDWLTGHGVEFGKIEPTEGWRDIVAMPLGYHDKPGLRWEGLGSDRMLDRLESALERRGVRIERGVRA